MVMSHIPNLALHHLSPQFQTTFLQRSVYRVNLCLCCAAFRGFFSMLVKIGCLNDGCLIWDAVSILVRVVAVEMGDPVVCTLVLVRDISLSLSLSISLSLALWPFILGQLWHLLQTDNIRTSVKKNQKHVCIVNIFNGFPLPGFWLTASYCCL